MYHFAVVASITLLAFPSEAHPLLTPPPTSTSSPITRQALQAEQVRDDAAVQRQRDQINGLTRQMQALKAQLDTLRHEMDETAAATDQVGEWVNQASKQKYGVRLRR